MLSLLCRIVHGICCAFFCISFCECCLLAEVVFVETPERDETGVSTFELRDEDDLERIPAPCTCTDIIYIMSRPIR